MTIFAKLMITVVILSFAAFALLVGVSILLKDEVAADRLRKLAIWPLLVGLVDVAAIHIILLWGN